MRSYGQDGTAVTETQTQIWNPDGSMAAVAIDYADASKPDVTVRYGYDHTGTLISRKVTRDSGSSVLPPVVVDWERYAVDHRNLTGYSQVAAVFKVSGENGQTNKLARLHFLTDQVAAQTDFTGTDTSGAATAITRNLHTDALGSIRTVNTRAQGSSVSSGGSGGGTGTGDLSVTALNYTAFGTPTESAFSLRPTEYAFTGQMRDSITGLQYHRARRLDTSLGNWSSSDSVFDFPLNVGNSYSYVGSCSTSNRDWSGLFTLVETVAVLAEIANITAIQFEALDFGLQQSSDDISGSDVASYIHIIAFIFKLIQIVQLAIFLGSIIYCILRLAAHSLKLIGLMRTRKAVKVAEEIEQTDTLVRTADDLDEIDEASGGAATSSRSAVDEANDINALPGSGIVAKGDAWEMYIIQRLATGDIDGIPRPATCVYMPRIGRGRQGNDFLFADETGELQVIETTLSSGKDLTTKKNGEPNDILEISGILRRLKRHKETRPEDFKRMSEDFMASGVDRRVFEELDDMVNQSLSNPNWQSPSYLKMRRHTVVPDTGGTLTVPAGVNPVYLR